MIFYRLHFVDFLTGKGKVWMGVHWQ